MLNTPILFLIFNRPNETKIVFEAIKRVRPSKLYIAADGPRTNIIGEIDLCNNVRQIISDGIDWNCEVKTLYREDNLGCGSAVQEALDWFFSEVEYGIILEDDTLPNNEFFNFCSALLEKYKNRLDIFSINGCSLGYHNMNSEYGVTNYFNMWGWATWRRSNEMVKKNWLYYLQTMNILKDKDVIKSLQINTIWDLKNWVLHWQSIFYKTANRATDTWDYQWVYTCLKTKSKSIRPSNNYIINIGYGNMATHTKISNHFLASLSFTDKKFQDTNLDNLQIDNLYERKYVAEIWNSYNIYRSSKFYVFISTIYSKTKRIVIETLKLKT